MRRYFAVGIAIVLSCAVTAIVVRGQSTAGQARMTATGNTGRYQIFFNPNVRADTFLLDTETGKAWVHAQYSEVVGEPSVWVIVPKLDNDQETRSWLATQTIKKSN